MKSKIGSLITHWTLSNYKLRYQDEVSATRKADKFEIKSLAVGSKYGNRALLLIKYINGEPVKLINATIFHTSFSDSERSEVFIENAKINHLEDYL